ncbi:MAG: triphosphoribosyl-dephospho-CoA synthase [Patescibacteria group bacterium]
MRISPKIIRQITQIALVLEPILDKDGCTTRYTDLPDKSLKDFLIAAVNVGEIIEQHAEEVINGDGGIFLKLTEAMEASNEYKESKNINFGLLVFIFIAIKARVMSSNVLETINIMKTQLETSTNKDVQDYMNGWKINIKTTTKNYKVQKTNENTKFFDEATSLKVLFERGLKVFSNPKLTGYQFCKENVDGYPLLKKFVTEINEKQGIITSLENTYDFIHRENPDLSVGMLADLCAAAFFLHLSFQNPKEYSIF